MPGEIPAAAIQWATLPRQRTVVATLETLAARARRTESTAPVITVIGWSVVLRDELNWFEQRPLFGKRIVVTRATQQAPALERQAPRARAPMSSRCRRPKSRASTRLRCAPRSRSSPTTTG